MAVPCRVSLMPQNPETSALVVIPYVVMLLLPGCSSAPELTSWYCFPYCSHTISTADDLDCDR